MFGAVVGAAPNSRSITRAVSTWRSGIMCEYVSRVIATLEWPRVSWTTFGLTPLRNQRVAAVCRRSWNRMIGIPALFSRGWKQPRTSQAAVRGRPVGRQKTKETPGYAGGRTNSEITPTPRFLGATSPSQFASQHVARQSKSGNRKPTMRSSCQFPRIKPHPAAPRNRIRTSRAQPH